MSPGDGATLGKAVGIIMTYNSSAYLEDIINRIPPVLDEIIVVDDASRDQDLSRSIAERHGIKFFPHEHLGYGGNMRFGFDRAMELGAEYMVEIHGDGQYDPSVIPSALAEIRKGYDLVLGSRFCVSILQPLRDGMSFARYFANLGLSWIERVVLWVPVSEFHTGFRIYSRNLVQTLPLDATSMDYLYGFQVIVQAIFFRLKISEVPVRADYRKDHTSISLRKATIYSFQTFYVLVQYILARMGFGIRLFARKN